MAQGEVVISARVNTSKAEKDLVRLEQDLEKFNDKGNRLLKQKADLEGSFGLEEEEKKYERIKRDLEIAKQEAIEMQRALQDAGATGIQWGKFGKQQDTIKAIEVELANQKSVIEQVNAEYEKAKPKLDKINGKIKDNANKQEEVKQKIKETNEEIKRQQLENIKEDLGGISNSTENIFSKVLKWGLALFSIRSAYNFITNAVGALSQSNEQIGIDIEYMRWALATVLQPIIEGLIKLAYQFLQYVNYIANAWFGVNLFANASTKAFEKTNKAVGGTVKQAKELQKTLTGIDEMNVLQKNGSVSSGGGGGGVTLPQTDLSQMLPDSEVPGWVKWIAENGDTIKNVIIGIVEAIALFKLAKLAYDLASVADGFQFFKDGMLTLSGAIVTAGIIVLIKGIADSIRDFEALINEPSWENFIVLIGDLGVAITGLGIILIGLNASNPFGWITLAIGGLGMLCNAIFGATEEEEKHESQLDEVTEASLKLKDAQDQLQDSYDSYYSVSNRAKKAEQELKEAEEKHHISAKELYQQYSVGTKTILNMTDAEKEVFLAYTANEKAQADLYAAGEDVFSVQGNLITQTGKLSGAVFQNTKEFDDNFKTMVEGYKEGQISTHDAVMYMEAMMDEMDSTTKKVFRESLPDSLAYAFKSNSFNEFYDKTTNSLKNIKTQTTTMFFTEIPNSISISTRAMENFQARMQSAYNLIKKFTGINIKTTFNSNGGVVGNAKGGIITKLATGGIVNRPGRGIPVASSQMGEAGREGILPLTDSQAMETLGQAIGRYITLNATVPVYVGNRQIAREIQKIQNEDDFAFNS